MELDPCVFFNLDDCMELCGIPSTKASRGKARRILKEDLEIHFSISLTRSEKRGISMYRTRK
ncbi:MAG: hypothetical protein LBU32_10310 [Clostridiales bacterium]|nr:hypothetical protein [Clostridiales bacterium]